MSYSFISKKPQLEDYWRGIILFGRNVASYKFALAKSLLELQPVSGELIKLEELAQVYSRHLTEHIRDSDKQCTSRSSKFLDGCRKFNSGEITESELIDLTVRHGFNNVIDAFHIVGQDEVPSRFYIDERKQSKGIRITDEFSTLLNREQFVNLPQEVEARWRLVEIAWELGVSRSIISISYDDESEFLFTLDKRKGRKSITGVREALNGYQKGKCFYCFSDIHVHSKGALYPDVDHFFPHTLKQQGFTEIIDGVWNLVLSCKECNRGEGGKFDRIPSICLLERLHRRNEYLIGSHHPLRETLIQQTGSSEAQRGLFLNNFHDEALAILINRWKPEEKDAPYF